MGRRSERLSRSGPVAGDPGDNDVIQVVSRAFDVLRCFDGHEARLGNLEISNRCKLPRSTVSRLTHTLTRMGQLVYLPDDQKYRIGPSAVALSTSIMRGLQFRRLIKLRLQEVAERVPGTIGLVVPDRFHMVYLEYGRAYHAVSLQSTKGTRVAIARTAAGHAYAAALPPQAAEALLADLTRENAEDAAVLRSRLDGARQMLADCGYVVCKGLWNPHISGIATPLWSEQYRTFLVVTIGLLAAMYDDARLETEVAPQLLELRQSIRAALEGSEIELAVAKSEFGLGQSPKLSQTSKLEDMNDLAAGARRTGPPRSLRARDGRRREG